MQSDGKRLWIPIAETKRKGRSIIRVFPLAGSGVWRHFYFTIGNGAKPLYAFIGRKVTVANRR